MLYMLYMGLDWSIYPAIFSDPIFIQTLWNTVIFVGFAVNVKMFLALVLSALFSTEHRTPRILAGVFLLPWAIPALPGILAFRWMLNGQWGIVNKILNDLGFARLSLAGPPAHGAGRGHHLPHLEVPSFLDADLRSRPAQHSQGTLRGRRHRRHLARCRSFGTSRFPCSGTST